MVQQSQYHRMSGNASLNEGNNEKLVFFMRSLEAEENNKNMLILFCVVSIMSIAMIMMIRRKK